MKQPNRLSHRNREEEQVGQHQRPVESTHMTTEFASAEAAVRQDRELTEVPSRVAERLEGTIRQEPRPTARWWRRLFRRP